MNETKRQYFAAYWIDSGHQFNLYVERFQTPSGRDLFCRVGRARPVSARMFVGDNKHRKRIKQMINMMKKDIKGLTRQCASSQTKHAGMSAQGLTEKI